MRSWTTTEVCDITGLSYRMLDHWARRGAIAPSIAEGDGSGSYRAWSELDVACLRAIAEVTRDLATLRIPFTRVEFIGSLWARLRRSADVLVCEGTVTISASRPLVNGR